MDEKNLQELAESYSAQLKEDPGSVVFFPLTEVYRRLGQVEQAIATAHQGLGKWPNYWSAKVALARAYLDQGIVDEAKTFLEEVVSAVPYNLMATRILGWIYVRQGDLEAARVLFRNALISNPEDEDIRIELEKLSKASSAKPEAKKEPEKTVSEKEHNALNELEAFHKKAETRKKQFELRKKQLEKEHG